MNMRPKFLVLTMVFSLIVPFSLAAQSEQCLIGNNARIVVMIDQTRSISAAHLESEKEAVRALLRYFALLTSRPSISIGTFNVLDDTNPASAARILAPLTSNYGSESPPTDLFAVINQISGSSGNTDLSVALSTVRAELARSASNQPAYVVLISDGQATRPGAAASGYNQCGACGCADATNAAIAAADALKTAPINARIFAVFQSGEPDLVDCAAEGQPQAGIDLLRSGIATADSYFFADSNNLSALFQGIASQVACDDGNPCTVDQCSGNSCSSTPVVPGNPNAVPDRCGVCGGDGSLCLGCQVTSSASLNQITGGLRQEISLLSKGLSYVPRSSSANKKFVNKTKKTIAKLNKDALTALNPIHATQACTNTKFCRDQDNRASIAQLQKVLGSLKKIGKSIKGKASRSKKVTSWDKNLSKIITNNSKASSQLPQQSSNCG